MGNNEKVFYFNYGSFQIDTAYQVLCPIPMRIQLSPIRFRKPLIIIFFKRRHEIGKEMGWEVTRRAGGRWWRVDIFKMYCTGIKTPKNKYAILKICVLKETVICTLNRCVLFGFVGMLY